MMKKKETAPSDFTTRNKEPEGKLYLATTLSFIISILLCSLIIIITIINRSDVEKLRMEQLISNKSVRITEVITKLLYKTEALSSLVIQSNGKIENFEKIAENLIDDPAILNVLIAPDGIVTSVYPLVGNEAVLGLNFFGEGEGNREAILAKETGQLVFGGPFNLVQGGQALVGRLPVYVEENGAKEFWGLVSITLKYPDALDDADLKVLVDEGFAYEIWRVSPETGEKQIISISINQYQENTRFVEKSIKILNSEWFFRMAPVSMWYEYTETWVLSLSGLLISFLIAFVIQNNYKLRKIKNKMEEMAHRDSLTGIYNRRFFMENSPPQIEKAIREKSDSFILMLDIDRFKNVNDNYGHMFGDEVLKEMTRRVKAIIRPYDLFARYGGEEFVLLVSGIKKENVIVLAERIKSSVFDTSFSYNGKNANVTVSIGIAKCGEADELKEAINNSDVALYSAKNKGRNRVEIF